MAFKETAAEKVKREEYYKENARKDKERREKADYERFGTTEKTVEKMGQVDAMGNPVGMKAGGKVGSASKRADGCAMRGKTRGKIV